MSVNNLRFILAAVSLLLFLHSFHPARFEQQLRQAQAQAQISDQFAHSYPQKVSIASILEVEVEPATQIGSKFLTSDDKASYFVNSASPNQQGNTIIYGHNKKGIFKKLHQLKGNEIITLIDQVGKQTDYQVQEILVAEPDQIEYLAPSDEDILTLYTCTGWADSKRLVVRAINLQDVLKDI
jgi:LPXTG-site transpeptidase (sortase) family protein